MELQKEGKHKQITIEEMSKRIGYNIEDNPELLEALQKSQLIEFSQPNFLRFKVLSEVLYFL